MIFGRYDYASFAMFAAYAAVTLAIPVVLVQLADELKFSLAEGGTGKAGWLSMTRNFAVTFALITSGFIAGRWGNRRPLGFAMTLITAGMFACSVSPAISGRA